MKIFGFKKTAIVLFALAVMMLTASLAGAAEFTADLSLKGGQMSGDGKIWVKGNKFRQEFGGPAGSMVMIMDLDEGASWMMMPESKTFIKNKVETSDKAKGFSPENFAGFHQGDMKANVKKVGSETVDGFDTEKYEISFDNAQMGTMELWFAKKLGFPIKMVGKGSMMGEMLQQLSNIKETKVDDDKFKVPDGYTEMQMPAGMTMPSGK